ncbi:MAG: response regulator [Coriobacteriales bacterium]|nr:response regulator [Coriobacteriales bacterium]
MIIISAIAITTAANLGVSLLFTKQNLIKTTEADIKVIAQIADEYITSEINLLRSDVARAAQYLETRPEEELTQALEEQASLYRTFLGMAILKKDGVITRGGTNPASAVTSDSDTAHRAFNGEEIISTTRYTEDGTLVFDVCVPMANERVLAVTVPGLFFSNLLSSIRVWETGSIFMVDNEGTIIASGLTDRVAERLNFINAAKQDEQLDEIASYFSEMIKGEPTSGLYTLDGQRRLCFAVPVAGSKIGWSLGVVAPLEESPITQLRHDLLLSELTFFVIAAVIAVFASKRIVRPLEEKYRRNEELAKLKVKAERASKAKSTFLANTSHEMRTPLNAIIGLSELQLLENHDAATQEDLARIHHAGTTLLSIINDILDISKVESGKFAVIPVEYDTPSLINDTIVASMTRIGSKPIEFILQIDETLPARLYGDELRVKQIFNNLLSNAFKYTKEGFVTWTIGFERRRSVNVENSEQAAEGTLRSSKSAPVCLVENASSSASASFAENAPYPEETVWLVSSVTDTGVGIKPEDIERLFTDYNQVDVKSNRTIEGTGLGLAITQRLLEIMGGTIEVRSVYGHGSTFTVCIPQGFASEQPIGSEVVANLQRFRHVESKHDLRAAPVSIQLPYARVLLVDDNQTNLAVARGMMKRYGMQVDCVDNGPGAIELIRNEKHRYHAIFMDHMMPGMDGIEAFERIRAIKTPYATTVPIIALTANAIAGNAEMFESKGFAAFLSKPVDLTQLDAIIRRWVRDREYEKSIGQDFESKQAELENPETPAEPLEPTEPTEPSTLAESVEPTEPSTPTELKGLQELGVNVSVGLERLDGSVDEYLKVLRTYVAEMALLLADVDELATQRLDDYAIVVHGIKGSSRAVGAEELAAMANKLETAAQTRDGDFVSKHTGMFIEQAKLLIAGTETVLDAVDTLKSSWSKPSKNKPDSLALTRLYEAAEDFSIDGVEDALEELEQYDYQVEGKLVVWLREQCNDLAFNEIVVHLSDYIETEEGEMNEYQNYQKA